MVAYTFVLAQVAASSPSTDHGAPATSEAVASSDRRIKGCLVPVGDARRKRSESLVPQADRARGHEGPCQYEGLTMKYASRT